MLASGCQLLAYDMLASEGDAGAAADAGSTDGGGDAGLPATGPCKDNGGCDANATCTVAGDAPVCTCKQGWEAAGDACVNVDECARGTAGCHALASCVDSAGSFACQCPDGYQGDGKACTDVNECATNNGGCPEGADCTNTDGSRTCACGGGYTAVGDTCVDIDDCAIDNGGCSPNAVCHNLPASRTCTCKPGYDGDGFYCTSCGACTVHKWASTSAMGVDQTNADMFGLGQRIVVVGGADGDSQSSTASKDLWTSTINADGSLGTFSKSARPMTNAHSTPCLARSGNRLYVAGSYSSNAVEFLDVTSDSLGAWTTTTAVPGRRFSGQCAVVNGALYVFAGLYMPDFQAPAPVFRGVLAPDGTIATWETLGGEGILRQRGASFQKGDRVYLAGGLTTYQGGAPTRSVNVAHIQANGSITWSEGRELPVEVHDADAVVVGDRVYLTTGITGAVFSSLIASDGSLGPWETEPGHEARGRINLAHAANRLFVVPGNGFSAFTSFR